MSGELGEVTAIAAESFIRRFRILRRHALVATYLFQRLRQFFPRDAKFLENTSSRAAIVCHREQQVFDRDVFILELFGFVFSLREQPI